MGFSQFEAIINEERKVREVKSNLEFGLLKPFFLVIKLKLLKFYSSVSQEKSEGLSKTSDLPIAKTHNIGVVHKI